MGELRHVRPGEPITAEFFNALAEALERAANLTVADGSGLVLHRSPGGMSLAVAVQTEIWARLSGTTSPYSFTQVREDTGGTWTTPASGYTGTSNAYEINSRAGLDGKIARLWRTPAGDWRFDAECLTCGCSWVITVVGCTGGGISGATVTVTRGGSTIGTGTTDGSGQVTLSHISSATGFTIAVTPPAGSGFANFSGPATHVCPSGGAADATTVTLTADTDHVCTACCNYPVAKTLTTTDGNGAHTLTWNGSIWTSVTIDSGLPAFKGDGSGFNCCADDGTCHYTIGLSCIGGVWRLGISFGNFFCGVGGNIPPCINGEQVLKYASAPGSGTSAAASSGTCSPFSQTFSIPTTVTNSGQTIATPGGGGAMTVTP